jgi:tetratricopeptide (TPR) repeat protein
VPSFAGDARTGLLAGCALLTKFSAGVPLLAIAAALALRALRPGLEPSSGRRRLFGRAALISLVAALVCGGYYARNLREFGTPFPMSEQRPMVTAFESTQPPGERGLSDLVTFSPRLFLDPNPRALHMLHSIWGTAYAGMWVHLDAEHSGMVPMTSRALLLLGLLPAALAAFGLGISLQTAWRDPDASVDTTLLILTGVGLCAFVGFAYRVPTFAALKATYLLNLSAAYAFFLARAVAALAARPSWRIVCVSAVTAPALVAAGAYARGPGAFPDETVQMAPVRAHFGDWQGASAIYHRELAVAVAPGDSAAPRRNPFWLMEMVGAMELLGENAARAYAIYDESFQQRPIDESRGVVRGRGSPYVVNRLAVAAALAGDRARARELLDAVLADHSLPEPLSNRAALLALAGDLPGAEADLRAALEMQPGLAAAVHNHAWILERRGDARADTLFDEARRAAERAPRDYPYGAGDGRGLNTQRFMLVLEGAGVELYRPARARTANQHEDTSPAPD